MSHARFDTLHSSVEEAHAEIGARLLPVNQNIFFVGLILAGSGFVSPPIALLGGLIFGFTATHPLPVESKRLAKFLLQASVVALGFGMNLHEVIQAGRSVSY